MTEATSRPTKEGNVVYLNESLASEHADRKAQMARARSLAEKFGVCVQVGFPPSVMKAQRAERPAKEVVSETPPWEA